MKTMAAHPNGLILAPERPGDDEVTFQADLLNSILANLLYQDLEAKPQTKAALMFINESKELLNVADALLIEGMLIYDKNNAEDSARLLNEAESMGCTHPILYHYLQLCWFEVDDQSVAVDPYERCLKSIAGKLLLICSNSDISLFPIIYSCY